MQDQEARNRGVVQLRPCDLDLLQLAQHIAAEVENGALIVGFVRVQAKLTVHLTSGKPQRSAEGEGAVGEP